MTRFAVDELADLSGLNANRNGFFESAVNDSGNQAERRVRRASFLPRPARGCAATTVSNLNFCLLCYASPFRTRCAAGREWTGYLPGGGDPRLARQNGRALMTPNKRGGAVTASC